MVAPALPSFTPKHDPQDAAPKGKGTTPFDFPARKVQAIPTHYMKRQSRLKRLFGRLTLINVVLIFAFLVMLGTVYAWKVALSSRLDAQTQAAKLLYEENMNLEVELNQLRSFQNIQTQMAKVPHLVAAKEKYQVPSTPNDWDQPILLGQERLIRHPTYTPFAGF
jgi:cell division protein FtsB